MKTKYFTITVLLALLHLSIYLITANAQIVFQKTYGGDTTDAINSVQQTADGGYIMVGYTMSFGAGASDVYLIKCDSNGNEIWTRTYGGSSDDVGRSVQQTNDGGYIITGYTSSFGSGAKDVYLIRTDGNGDTLWTKAFGLAFNDDGYSVQQTTDEGYIITGYHTGNLTIGYEATYLIKTDSMGDTLWTKIYGGGGLDAWYGYDVQQTSDAGYIVTGMTSIGIGGGGDAYAIKTDSIGNIQWSNAYGATGCFEECYSVQQTADSGFIMAGYTCSFTGSDGIYLLKINANGNILWSKKLGASGCAIEDYGGYLAQTNDGGYILAGYSSCSANKDIQIIKTDINGNIQWSKRYGGANYDEVTCIKQTVDGGYIFAGRTKSFGAGEWDAYLFKTDSNGNINGCNEIVSPVSSQVTSSQMAATGGLMGSEGFSNNTATIVGNTAPIISDPCADTCNISSSFTSSLTNICEGETINFTNTSSGAISYEWQEDSISFSTATDTARTFNIAGTYIISLIADSGSCSDSSGVAITVNPTYSTSTPDETICNGDSVMIFGIYRTTAGTYYDSLITVNSCDSVIATTLIVNSLPTVNLGADTTICNVCSIILDAGAGFINYNWSTGENSQTIIVNSANTYIVQVTDVDSCISGDTIVLDIASNVGKLSNSKYINIYPNPTTGKISLQGNLSQNESTTIILYNVLGELVYDHKLESNVGSFNHQIDLFGLRGGIYMLQVEQGNTIHRKKIIKL